MAHMRKRPRQVTKLEEIEYTPEHLAAVYKKYRLEFKKIIEKEQREASGPRPGSADTKIRCPACHAAVDHENRHHVAEGYYRCQPAFPQPPQRCDNCHAVLKWGERHNRVVWSCTAKGRCGGCGERGVDHYQESGSGMGGSYNCSRYDTFWR
jgi:hypothetical protein